jgi:hypothetical protein
MGDYASIAVIVLRLRRLFTDGVGFLWRALEELREINMEFADLPGTSSRCARCDPVGTRIHGPQAHHAG